MKMIVIGLDCAAPALVFDRYRDAMPNVSALAEEGTWGTLRSSEPPITVPAWTCMLSGRDPGELGLYGFRSRVPGETGLRLANGGDVRVKRVWDWLGEQGLRVAPLFVPLTSPPPPVRGHSVSGFLWPGDQSPWCFPRALEDELEARFGRYQQDVEDFRSDDLSRIFEAIQRMTDQHFDIAEHVWSRKQPDFMMMVEIGVDRFHHAFWHHIDPTHPRHPNDPRWLHAGREYYAQLDSRIGALRRMAGEEVAVIVVSDHGARAMIGGFCINQWLIREGYLALRKEPEGVTPLTHDRIDWTKTRAWAEGGYYARVFLNVAGREPRGIVAPEEASELTETLAAELGALTDQDGAAVQARVSIPHQTYRQARGFPPDLMVYFDDLALRAIGSVGHRAVRVEENDTGPDSCNHDWDGIFVMGGADLPKRGRVEGAEIYDVTPTILSAFGIERPPGILGRDWAGC